MKEKIMKSFLRGFIAVVTFVCICVSGTGHIDVQAGGFGESDLKLNVGNKGYSVSQMEQGYYTLNLGKQFKNMRLTCTSSNKKVVGISDCYVNDKLKSFNIHPIKPGKSTVTFKAYKKNGKKYKLYKTYKMKIQVYKYEQPIKSAKIGKTVVKQIEDNLYVFTARNWPAKKKMSVICKKNWKIISVKKCEIVSVKDGEEFRYQKNAKNIVKKATPAVSLQRGSWEIIIKNTKTKVQESVDVLLY